MNILLTVLGWLAWNFGLFSWEKDKADNEGKEFPILQYVKKYWDNWLLSALFIPILIIIGIKGLDLSPLPLGDVKDMKWSDLYYLLSGAASEAAKVGIQKVFKWKSKKEQE